MNHTVANVVVVEHGAALPPGVMTPAPTADDADNAVIVCQQPEEDERSFRQRVAHRLRTLATQGTSVPRVSLLLGGKREEASLERRLMLAQTVLKSLPDAENGELVLRGELGQTSAGQLDVFAMVETLTATASSWTPRIKALFEVPVRTPRVAVWS